ncbi:MAG TPA: hypothetical protein VKV02_11940 [Acidobacteriaceae bacterium]|nr:hypothetical protein [Acidobacteriaceae bacterium]
MAKMSPAARSTFAVLDGLLLFLALEGVFYAIAFLVLQRSFDTPTPLYLACNFLWAVIAGGLGGYTAGWVARRSPVAHGLAVAFPLILLGIFNLHKGLGGNHTTYVLLLNSFVPVFAVWGSFLAGKLQGSNRRVSR